MLTVNKVGSWVAASLLFAGMAVVDPSSATMTRASDIPGSLSAADNPQPATEADEFPEDENRAVRAALRLDSPPPLTRTISTRGLITDGFAPGSVDPTNAALAASQTWTLGELIVEESEATELGYVEYKIRGTLRADASRQNGAEVVAVARAVSPEVSVVSESLHFTTRAADDLDSLSPDAIRVRVKGGLTFEPSMLRWNILSTPATREPESRPSAVSTASETALEASELAPAPAQERLP